MADVAGSIGDDRLIGTESADRLRGLTGNDRIEGRGGDDVISGGQGVDFLDGGAGHDLVSFADSLSAVTVDLGGGWADDGIWRDQLLNFEGVIGSIFDDVLIGATGADELLGNDGADRIDGGAGDDLIDGGQGDDDLTGGTGNDRFVHSVSDGNDRIRDFGDGDRLEIAGYAAAQSIIQDGADVVVTLAPGDSVRIANSDVGFVTARVSFTPLPRPLFPAPVVDSLLATPGLLIGEDVVVTSLNPLPAVLGSATITDAALIARSGNLFLGGSVILFSAGDGGDAKGVVTSGVTGTPGPALVTGADAVVEVHSQSDGWGVLGLGDVFNAGLISVIADRAGGGIVDSGLTDAGGAHALVNSGVIRVAGNLVSSGIGPSDVTPGLVGLIANSGTIDVRGASGSAGIVAAVGAGSALMNSGTIAVVDADLNRQAVGLLLDWQGSGRLWNSGTITADLGITLFGLPSLAAAGATLGLVNSGTIGGGIDLSGSGLAGTTNRTLSIVNSGAILGNVVLGPGGDLYDGRGGSVTGAIRGLAGNDVLLAGVGAQTLDGGAGDDLLSGGAGDDLLTGGAGADRFRFEAGFARDTITDLNPGEGDRIEVRGYSGWTALSQEGGDVVISFAAGDQLILRGRLIAEVTAAFFTFGAPAIAPASPAPPPAIPSPPLFAVTGTAGPDRLLGHGFGDLISGGGGNDVLTGGAGADQLSGGAGRDLFRDTLAGHDGDTISDFTFGDRVVFSDASPAGFSFSLSGSTLRYPGGSLTLAALPAGTLAASPAAGGGVQLILAAPAPGGTAPLFARAGSALVANFNPASGWVSQNLFPRHLGDVNGDGFADVVGFGIAGVWVSYGTAGGGLRAPVLALGNFGQTAGWLSDDRYPRALADVDGDGRADVVGFGQAGVWVALASASGGFAAPRLGLADFGQAQGWASQDGYARLVGDVNGDGRADIVGFGTAGTWVALGSGDGGFSAPRLSFADFGVAQGWSSDERFHRALADVDGDGAADLVAFGIAGTYVAFSRGDGSFADPVLTMRDFGTAQGWVSDDASPRLVADVNGDGLADIIAFTRVGTSIAFGHGDGTFAAPRSDVADFGIAQGWSSDTSFHRELADLNHDGMLDLVGFGFAGVLTGQNGASLLI